MGAGNLAIDCSSGVGVVSQVDHLEGTVPEVLGVVKGPKHSLQGVDNIA